MKKNYILLLMLLSTISNAQIPNTITTEDKIYGISKFWQEANYNFAYFENIQGLNFDSLYQSYIPKVINSKNDYEYYRLLKRFCSSLKDGHTTIYYPSYIEQIFSTPAIKITRIKDKLYIINVGKSYKNLILRGSEIIKVEDKNTLEYLNENVYPYTGGCEHIVKEEGAKNILTGFKGNNTKITVKEPNGDIKTIKIEYSGFKEDWLYPNYNNEYKKSITYRQLDDSIAYLAIHSFWYGKDSIYSDFSALLPKLIKQKGLVLDLRGNKGGIGSIAYEIAKHFTNKSYFLAGIGSTRKHLPSYKAWGAYADSTSYAAKFIRYIPGMKEYLNYYKDNVWEYEKQDTIFTNDSIQKLLMPLAILTDYYTGSSTEDFLICLDNMKRGIRIGQKTSGSTGQQLYFEMPGGGRCQICVRKCTFPDGRKYVGIGIKPDIEIEPTLDYYLSDSDIVLEKAIKYLKRTIH